MSPSVYIETSIVSYLVARPSRDAVMAERQRQTREWWEQRRWAYTLVTSDVVIREAQRGEPSMAQARVAALNGIRVLDSTPEITGLADDLVAQGPLPPKATADAIHIALAAWEGIETLLTWNCKHMANPRMYPAIQRVGRAHGLEMPRLCTPEDLLKW